MAVLDSDIDPDDIVGAFISGRAKTVPLSAYDMIGGGGYDPSSPATYKGEIDLTGAPLPITETTLADPADKQGGKFIEASKTLMSLFPKRFSSQSSPLSAKRKWLAGDTPDEAGDEVDPAQWGLEFMGWFMNNLASMGMSLYKIQDAPENQKEALLTMMELYIAKDITWEGTTRAFKAVLSDPSTYLGLGTLGIGTALGASAKQATKRGLMAALKASLPAAKLGAAEGALFGAAYNVGEQKVRIEANQQPDYDLGETAGAAAVSAGGGAVIAPAIVAASRAVTGAFGRLASSQRDPGGTPLRSINESEAGVPAIISPQSVAPLEGTQAVPDQISDLSPPSAVSAILASNPPKLTGVDIPPSDIKILLSNNIYQFLNDVTSLVKQANAYKPILEDGLDKIADEVPGVEQFELGARVKKKDSLDKKIAIKTMQPNELSDVLGGRLVANNMDDVEQVKAIISRDYAVIEIEDFQLKPKPGGYRAVHIQIMSSNGLSMEVQVQVKEIRAAQDWIHPKYYEPWKGKENLTPDEKIRRRKDVTKAEDAFNEAWNMYLRRAERPEILMETP